MVIKKKNKNTLPKKSEKEIIPSEKWLASFKNHNNKKSITPQILLRQF